MLVHDCLSNVYVLTGTCETVRFWPVHRTEEGSSHGILQEPDAQSAQWFLWVKNLIYRETLVWSVCKNTHWNYLQRVIACFSFRHLAAFQNMNSKRKAETWKKNRRQLVRLGILLNVHKNPKSKKETVLILTASCGEKKRKSSFLVCVKINSL